MTESELNQVVALELALLTPEVRGSRDRLEELIDADFVEIGASGRRWNGAEIIEALASDPGADAIEIVDVEARQIAADVVLVSFLTEPNGRTALRTSIWRRTASGWRIVHHQGTLRPTPGG